MYDSLHIVIHQDPSRGGRRGRASSGASAGLRDPGNDTTLPLPDDPGNDTTLPLPDDPGNDTTLPLPDDPGNDTTLPLPDDPGNDTTLPLPDDPRLRWAGPSAVSVYEGLPPFGYGAGYGCGCGGGCACSCGDDKPARPEMLPGNYSGFVIVRVAPGVELNNLEELWHVADDNGLDGLKAVLELETEWQAGGGTGNGGGEEPGSAEGGSSAKLGFGEVFRRQRRADGKGGGGKGGGGKGGGGKGGGAAGGGEAVEPAPGLRTWPLIAAHGCLSREAVVGQILALETKARSKRLAPLHSLTRYWRVDLRPYPEKAQEVVDRFNALAEVELAYRELAAADPGGYSSTSAPPAPGSPRTRAT